MKKAIVLLVVLAAATTAFAAAGDSWILPIDHTEGGGLTAMPGIGWNGTDALQGAGPDGVRRVYWNTLNVVQPTGAAALPASTELYTMEYFKPAGGTHQWQPIESRISGGTEIWPNDPSIPWAGMWGSNHQYIAAWEGGAAGTWCAAGAGPHTPESDAYTAGANGIYMWLHSGSQLYVKWDYGWSIDNTVSAIRLTQITPEPVSALLLLLGLPLLRRKAR